jgi:hypothetical protein
VRFNATPITFGPRPTADDDQDAAGLPAPKRIKLKRRRMLAMREAAELVRDLPAEGEAVHCLMSRRMDLADILQAILDARGTCSRLVIATLGFSPRNLASMLKWLDNGSVAELWLLASKFYVAHNGERWQTTVDEFGKRGQHCAAAPSHAKVCVMTFSDASYVCEGSSNLCGSGSSVEQVAIINHVDLADWHARWITEKIGNG